MQKNEDKKELLPIANKQEAPNPFLTYLKWGSFCILVIQTSGATLVTRYSRVVQPDKLYIASTAVLMAECIKFLFCTVGYSIEYYQTENRMITPMRLFSKVFGADSDWAAMAVPAVLYFVQNILQFTAFTYLDPATFQIVSQFKLFTTAFFSVIWLGKRIDFQKWVSLFFIVVGIVLVQYENMSSGKQAKNLMLGLVLKIISCFLSGFAGVWFEGAIKGKKSSSLLLRNIQLSFFSIIPGFFIAVCLFDGAQVRANGFYYGYTIWTWFSIFFLSFGGLLIAVVVKYADTILKVIATTLAIIVSSVLSVFIFNFQIKPLFVLGASIVMTATYFYVSADIVSQFRAVIKGLEQNYKPILIGAAIMSMLLLLSLQDYAYA